MADKKSKRVYGRRTGRPLNKERSEALTRLYPTLEIPSNLLTEQADLDKAELFGNKKPTWLEIGFGNGEHLLALMERHKEYNFIGAEPFINGMSAFLKQLESENSENIRVLMDDAMLIANSLSDETLAGIYILNPDPWHKKRHHKRRIVNDNNLDQFARILEPGGLLIMSTDVPDLAEWMVTMASRHPAFNWCASSYKDWKIAPSDWITTRYEEKGAKGAKSMTYLIFKKIK